jgi:hypothetical protein
MCDQNVGVAKRIDLESISSDIADLFKELDNEVKIKIPVRKVKNIRKKLEKLIK